MVVNNKGPQGPTAGMNPLMDAMGGYYEFPGKKFARKPKPFMRKPVPVEFNFKFSEDLVRLYENEADIPQQIKNNIWKQEEKMWQNAWKVSGNPNEEDEVTTEQMEIMEEIGLEEGYPGLSGASVSLDMKQWTDSPQKMLEKTVKEWWRDATSMEEMEAMGKAKLWSSIVDGEAPPTTGKNGKRKPVLFGQAAVDAITDSSIATTKMGTTISRESAQAAGLNNPLQLKNRHRTSTGEIDPTAPWQADLDQVGDAVVTYMTYSTSGSGDKKHDKYLRATRGAITTQIEAKLGIGGYDESNPAFNAKARKLYDDDADLRRRVDTFRHTAGLIDSIEGVDGIKPGKGLGGLTQTLEKTAMGYKDGKIWDIVDRKWIDAAQEVKDKHQAVATAILKQEKAMERVRKAMSGDQQLLDSFNRSIEKHEELMTHLKKTLFTTELDVDPQTGQKVIRIVMQGNTAVASPKVQSILTKLKDDSVGITTRAQMTELLSEVNLLRKGGLTGSALGAGTLIDPGAARKLSRQLIEGGFGNLNKGGGDLDIISSALQLEDMDALKLITFRTQMERTRHNFRKGLEVFEDGEMWKVFYFKERIRERYKIYTPAYHLERFLKNMHYFGLNIDDDILYDPRRTPEWLRKIIIKSEWAKNKFDIKVPGFGIAGKALPIKSIVGGRHFLIVESLHSWGHKELTNDVTGVTEKFFKSHDEYKAFLVEFLKDPNSTKSLAELERLRLFLGFDLGDPKKKEQWERMMKNLHNFREWMVDNAKKMGIDLADGGMVGAFVKGLFDYHKLPGTGGITQEFTGLMEKFVIKLNQLQGKLFGKFAPYIQMAMNLRTIIVEGATKLITNALAAVLGGATGGLAAPLAYILETVVRFVVTKLEELGEAFLAALRNGDFSKVFAGLQKSFFKFFKLGMLASGAPIIALAAIMFFTQTTVSTLSPVNVTRPNASGIYLANMPSSNGNLPNVSCSTDSPTLAELDLPRDSKVESDATSGDFGSSVAKTAYNLVDKLSQGFWCYWNKSPDFPNLWNEAKFRADPTTMNVDGGDLFWCTWLIQKAYGRSNMPSDTLWVPTMLAEFQNTAGYHFISAQSDVRDKLKPGDVVFMGSGGATSGKHVGIVYKINVSQGVETEVIMVNSNAGLKVFHFPILGNGNVGGAGGLSVIGFGKKN